MAVFLYALAWQNPLQRKLVHALPICFVKHDNPVVADNVQIIVDEDCPARLYAADRLPEADQLEEMFTDYLANHGPETLHQVYIAAVARTLVEFSPVVKRQELGKREDHRPFMNRLLRLTLDYAEQPRELRQFLGDASRLERNGS